MLSVKEAIKILLDNSKRLVESEEIDLIEASGRTLASNIIAPSSLPFTVLSLNPDIAEKIKEAKSGRQP